MIKYSKALLEVWDWKEEIFQERKDMSIADWARLSRENSQALLKKYNIKKTTRKAKSGSSTRKKASVY